MHVNRGTNHLSVALSVLFMVIASVSAHAVNWLQSTDNREPWELALDLAKRNREPIMAFVHVENPERWRQAAQLTQMMDDLTFANEAVSEAAKEFLCVRVDVFYPENGPFLDRYGLRRTQVEATEDIEVGRGHAYPVTLFVSPAGNAEHMVYGFLMADAFLKVMGEAKQVIQLREQLDEKPDDAKALAKLGELYVELQRYGRGREVLEKAIQLDADSALGIGETALLDLGVAVMADENYSRAIELLTTHIGTFPNSELRCKARFLLGGAMLAAAETTQQRAEELGSADGAGAAAAREEAQLQRRQALEAWQWFEGDEEHPGPCPDSEWERYSLGALERLRVEIAFRDAENVAATDPKAGISALRTFIEKSRESKVEGAAGRVYDAEFLIGRSFMASEQWANAADHWRGLVDRYPPQPSGSQVAEPEFADTCEAMFLLGECLVRLGKQQQALKQWEALASEELTNPCRPTVWPAKATTALEEHTTP
jgi:tetratricopeptide (TPR) repeat protein